jgi:hypothetical protein
MLVLSLSLFFSFFFLVWLAPALAAVVESGDWVKGGCLEGAGLELESRGKSRANLMCRKITVKVQ